MGVLAWPSTQVALVFLYSVLSVLGLVSGTARNQEQLVQEFSAVNPLD